MKRILFALAAVLTSLAAYGATFQQLRSTASGKALPNGFVLEGIVISDYKSPNMESNPNLAWDRVDLGATLKTAYLESPDGQWGVKLVFENIYENRLARGSRVSVDLSGCVVSIQKTPKAYTITGVRKSNVTVLEENVPIPVKKKKMSELTDNDVYTYVSIQDVEFVDKQGSYCNVYELCTQPCFINRTDFGWSIADGWATLLEDKEGVPVYMQVNSTCNWRRNNLGVPKGVGELSGIVVCNQLPRYGGSIGRYSIRPVDITDISIPKQETSSFQSIVCWKWDRNYECSLKTENGLSPWHRNKGITNGHVLADEGEGELYCEADCDVLSCDEFDTRHCTDGSGTGSRQGAAVGFKTLALEWYNGKGIVAKIPMTEVNADCLIVDFSIAGGNVTAGESIGVPSQWVVKYSVDGTKYEDTGLSFGLNPLVFKPDVVNNVTMYPNSNEAMGYSQYTVKLPSKAIGKDMLFIKLVPNCKKPSELPDETPVMIRLGKFELKTLNR